MGHPSKSSHRGKDLYAKLHKQNYPKGYQVLCWNCNHLKEVKRKKKYHSQSKRAISTRKMRSNLKKEVYSKYCSYRKIKCSCCGFRNIDALTLDHIDGRMNTPHDKNLGGTWLQRYLKNNEFPDIDIQVLCFNCNSAKANSGKCPHQK